MCREGDARLRPDAQGSRGPVCGVTAWPCPRCSSTGGRQMLPKQRGAASGVISHHRGSSALRSRELRRRWATVTQARMDPRPAGRERRGLGRPHSSPTAALCRWVCGGPSRVGSRGEWRTEKVPAGDPVEGSDRALREKHTRESMLANTRGLAAAGFGDCPAPRGPDATLPRDRVLYAKGRGPKVTYETGTRGRRAFWAATGGRVVLGAPGVLWCFLVGAHPCLASVVGIEDATPRQMFAAQTHAADRVPPMDAHVPCRGCFFPCGWLPLSGWSIRFVGRLVARAAPRRETGLLPRLERCCLDLKPRTRVHEHGDRRHTPHWAWPIESARGLRTFTQEGPSTRCPGPRRYRRSPTRP